LDTNHQETLFDGKGYSSGGYGGLEFKGTSIKDRAALLVGGRGGWIISNTFSIGLGLYGLTTTHEVYRDKSPNYLFSDSSNYYLRFFYGGIIIEYINSSNSLIHLTGNVLIGSGVAFNSLALNIYNDNYNRQNNNDGIDDISAFFVCEPSLMADINITKFFRIGVGGSYRYVSSLLLKKVSNGDLSGFSGNIIFKFGSF
jgi:hypothetical protein